jgi:hypothetical protein
LVEKKLSIDRKKQVLEIGDLSQVSKAYEEK